MNRSELVKECCRYMSKDLSSGSPFVTDPIGGYMFMLKFIEPKEICRETMEQALAQKLIEKIDMWDL